MKSRLILFILISIIPFAVKGQQIPSLHTDEPSNDVIFYSNANMYVGSNYTNGNRPTLYIAGSAKYVDSGTQANKVQITQLGITQLMGDFIDSLYVMDNNALNTLFSSASYDANTKTGGVILFAGESKRQRIYRQVNAGQKNYRGYNYINFPILRVNQKIKSTDNLELNGQVMVEPTSTISIEDLQIGNGYKGGFALDARYVPGTAYIQSPFVFISDINTASRETTSAAKEAKYRASDGWARVDLTLADTTKKETYIPNYHVGMNQEDLSRRYLTGFAPPFKKMAADYMFFQVLMQPNYRNLNSSKGVILDPDFKLLGGKGYFIAQEVSRHDYDEIEGRPQNHGVNRKNRFSGKYQFSRKLFDEYYDNGGNGSKPHFSRYRVNSTDIAEYFNVDTVTVALDAGLNFLGNPFTAPLDLKALVQPVDQSPNYVHDGYDAYRAVGLFKYEDSNIANSVDDYYSTKVNGAIKSGYVSVTRGRKTFTKYDLRGMYWKVKDGQIRYKKEAAGYGNWFYYSIGHYAASEVGSTTSLNQDTAFIIPPMGMFCIQSASAFNIKIIPPQKNVLRAGNVVAPKNITDKNQIVDELLIQVLDTDTGDEDRACLVFRDQKMSDITNNYIRTLKVFNSEIKDESVFAMPEGSVYTKSLNDGLAQPLLTNPVPKDIKQIALFVVPSRTRVKHIKILPYRMQSLQSINKVWIEDRLDPGVYKELTPEGVEYAIEPSTADPKTELANRFVLYFNDLPEGSKVEKENTFIVYYHNSTLYIKGLIDDDMGSKVDIYDIQGRKVASTVIRDVPTTSFLKPLAYGTYIVKITGKRNNTSKFISLQN